MWAALRYRRVQALVTALLSALVTASLAFAPLYTRALEQASVRTLLAKTPPADLGLRLSSTSATAPAIALDPDALAGLVPPDMAPFYGAPIASIALDVKQIPFGDRPSGRLVDRTGACDHLRLVTGRCPTSAGEVLVSTDQASVYAEPLGSSVQVGEFDGNVSLMDSSPRTALTVVGTYQQPADPYWFGDQLTGRASTKLGFDTMFTDGQTLLADVTGADGRPSPWFQRVYASDIPLIQDGIGVDEIERLGPDVAALVADPLGPSRAGKVADTVTVSSALPAVAAEVRTGSAQARVTVPLLLAQAALLLVGVLWLVLVAAAEARRGEVAVARLRGRGAQGARRLLLAETLPPLLVGVLGGALLAVGLSFVARRFVLPYDPPFEVPSPALLALAVVVVVLVATALLSIRRVSREPVATLIRRVPPRRLGLRLGVLEAMFVATAAAVVVALATGSLGGAVVQIAPTLVALAVGVVLARVLSLLLVAAGEVRLRQGRASGAALVSAGRRGEARWLVPVVTVGLCVVVVAADSLAIGARNWSGRAAVEVGAPTVLTLGTADLTAANAALRTGPAAAHATPVAVVSPGREGGVTTVAVVPGDFPRIASWPGVDPNSLAWSQLTAATAAPVTITGTQLTFDLTAGAFTPVAPVIRLKPDALVLAVRLVHDDGRTEDKALATLPSGGVAGPQAASLDCTTGCRISGIGILTPRATANVSGTVAMSNLKVDGQPADLGPTDTWRSATAEDVYIRGTFADGGVRFDYANDGFESEFLAQAAIPDVAPALTTQAATPSDAGATIGGSFVDGSALLLRSAGTLAYAPGGPVSTAVLNLDNLLAVGWRGQGSATLYAYVDSTDPAVVASVRSALSDRGISVTSERRAADVAADYAMTAAAWSLQLALVVGVLALLIAALSVVVLTATSWRARSADYAALRLVGERSRPMSALSRLETLPAVTLSALFGVAVGLWTAPATVSLVPLFTSPPPTFPVDRSTAWVPALLAAALGVVVMVFVGVLASRGVAKRATPNRLRGDV